MMSIWTGTRACLAMTPTLPVSEFNGHKVSPGPVVEILENALVRYVREYVDARAARTGRR